MRQTFTSERTGNLSASASIATEGTGFAHIYS
jgi:hypothetical protein